MACAFRRSFISYLLAAAAICVLGENPAHPGDLSSDPELHLLVGGRGLPGGTRANGQETVAIQVSYLQEIFDSLAAELTYRNEGHIEANHRDGVGALFWGRFRPLHDRVVVGFGIGPEMYFNTERANNRDGYVDAHGFTLLGGAAVQVDVVKGVFVETRLHRTLATSSFASRSLLSGVGFRLPATHPAHAEAGTKTRSSLFVSGGQSIVNSFHSEEGQAFAVQYEREVKGPYGIMMSYVNEGDARGFERSGIAIQPTVRREFLEDGRLALRLAAGPYFNTQAREERSSSRTAVLFSASANVRFTQHHGLYVSGNRVFTTNDKDADILLIGGVFSFEDD
jgi:hypothetical protein